jgi:hypothetical protein
VTIMTWVKIVSEVLTQVTQVMLENGDSADFLTDHGTRFLA